MLTWRISFATLESHPEQKGNPLRVRNSRRWYKYEVAVYNEDVRRMLKQGEKHKFLDDDWANIHYLEFTASGEQEARAKAHSKYPTDQGYVIENITPAMEI